MIEFMTVVNVFVLMGMVLALSEKSIKKIIWSLIITIILLFCCIESPCILGLAGVLILIINEDNKKLKSIEKVTSGSIMFVAFIVSAVAPSLESFCCFLIIIGGIVSIFSPTKKYIEDMKNKHIENEKNKEQELKRKAREQENAKIKEYDDKCIKVYEIYLKDNYDIKNDDVNNIISKSHNIPIEEIKVMYNRGKEVKRIREDEKKQAEIIAKREKENAIFQTEMQNSNFAGKDKYLNFLNTALKGYNATKLVYETMSELNRASAIQARNPKQTDPYILGGMASGIGGSVVGMMTANEIAAKNAKAKMNGERYAQTYMNESFKHSKEAVEYNGIISNLKKMIDKVNSLLIDDNVNKNFDKMKITETNYKILDTKNIEVTINYELGDIKVLNKRGILDGSFYICVLNSKDEKIAEGHYNTPNMEIINEKYVSSSNIGLKRRGNIKTVCIPENYSDIKSNEDYKIKIEPINLWTIEEFRDSSVQKFPRIL